MKHDQLVHLAALFAINLAQVQIQAMYINNNNNNADNSFVIKLDENLKRESKTVNELKETLGYFPKEIEIPQSQLYSKETLEEIKKLLGVLEFRTIKPLELSQWLYVILKEKSLDELCALNYVASYLEIPLILNCCHELLSELFTEKWENKSLREKLNLLPADLQQEITRRSVAVQKAIDKKLEEKAEFIEHFADYNFDQIISYFCAHPTKAGIVAFDYNEPEAADFIWTDLKTRVVIKNLLENSTLASFEFTSAVRDLAFSPDGLHLAIVTHDHKLYILNTNNWQLLKEIGINSKGSLSFSYDCKLLAIGGNSVELIDINLLQIVEYVETILPKESEKKIYQAVFTPDNKFLALCDSSQIDLWSLEKKGYEKSLKWLFGDINFISCSSQAKLMAVCALNNSHIRLLSFENSIASYDTLKDLDSQQSLAWSPDGRLLVSVSNSDYIKIWNPRTKNSLAAFIKDKEVDSKVAFVSNSLLAILNDSQISVWDISCITDCLEQFNKLTIMQAYELLNGKLNIKYDY